MCAPNTPRSTLRAQALERVAEGVVQRLGDGAGRGSRPGRAASLAGVGVQRELADHQQRRAEVGRRLLVGEDAQLPDLAGQRGRRLRRCRRASRRAGRPGRAAASRPTTSPSTVTDADEARCTTARMAVLRPGASSAVRVWHDDAMTACRTPRARPPDHPDHRRPDRRRDGQGDVPALPTTLEELVETAVRCEAAGAAMIHLHIRDDEHQPTLDIGRLSEAVDAVREQHLAGRPAVDRRLGPRSARRRG